MASKPAKQTKLLPKPKPPTAAGVKFNSPDIQPDEKLFKLSQKIATYRRFLEQSHTSAQTVEQRRYLKTKLKNYQQSGIRLQKGKRHQHSRRTPPSDNKHSKKQPKDDATDETSALAYHSDSSSEFYHIDKYTGKPRVDEKGNVMEVLPPSLTREDMVEPKWVLPKKNLILPDDCFLFIRIFVCSNGIKHSTHRMYLTQASPRTKLSLIQLRMKKLLGLPLKGHFRTSDTGEKVNPDKTLHELGFPHTRDVIYTPTLLDYVIKEDKRRQGEKTIDRYKYKGEIPSKRFERFLRRKKLLDKTKQDSLEADMKALLMDNSGVFSDTEDIPLKSEQVFDCSEIFADSVEGKKKKPVKKRKRGGKADAAVKENQLKTAVIPDDGEETLGQKEENK